MNKVSRLQSAMEYLMTYGWAILIIAVVLGALFQLGVFNSSSFSPRAPPGACQVFRPGGPGSTTNINLMGVCTGQLPQYVAKFPFFGYVTMPNVPQPTQLSLSVWVKPFSRKCGGCSWMGVAGNWDGTNGYAIAMGTFSSTCARWCPLLGSSSVCPATCETLNVWQHLAMTFDGTMLALYVNGVRMDYFASGSQIGQTAQALKVGITPTFDYFNGTIANLQEYNTSLTANQIQALYLEGIGGAPMKLQNLVGWWPLNGDAKDYSGNNNNGVPTAVTFTSQYGK